MSRQNRPNDWIVLRNSRTWLTAALIATSGVLMNASLPVRPLWACGADAIPTLPAALQVVALGCGCSRRGGEMSFAHCMAHLLRR